MGEIVEVAAPQVWHGPPAAVDLEPRGPQQELMEARRRRFALVAVAAQRIQPGTRLIVEL